MVTSRDYGSVTLARRSRLVSPIYKRDRLQYCVNFYFNINGKSRDGFKVVIENYLNNTEVDELRRKVGPFEVD